MADIADHRARRSIQITLADPTYKRRARDPAWASCCLA
jgi:hypothetical protein